MPTFTYTNEQQLLFEENMRNLHSLTILSSIPIKKLVHRSEPSVVQITDILNSGSCCLIDYNGKRLILTVSHLLRNNDEADTRNGTLYLETGMSPDHRLICDPINYLSYPILGLIRNGSYCSAEELDILIGSVADNYVSNYLQFSDTGELTLSTPRFIFNQPTFLEPSTTDLYSFSGLTSAEGSDRYLESSTCCEMALRYERSDNFFDYFKLSHPHLGHEHYKGCSGAPIINQEGRLIGLVSGGIMEENLIYGLKLRIATSILNELTEF